MSAYLKNTCLKSRCLSKSIFLFVNFFFFKEDVTKEHPLSWAFKLYRKKCMMLIVVDLVDKYINCIAIPNEEVNTIIVSPEVLQTL
jgi:hypothetical protein